MTKVTVRGRFIGGSIYQPKDNNGRAQYSACIVLDDGEEAKIEGAVKEAITAEFGSKAPKLQDWSVRVGDDEEYEHSFGKKFINPKSSEKKPPTLFRKVEGSLEPTEDIYAGCYVAASVNAYAYKGDKSKGVNPGVTLQLRGLLFLEDGEPLADKVTESEFEGYDSAETAQNSSMF